MDRRRFLKESGKLASVLAVAPVLPRLFASSSFAQSSGGGYKAIVCLNLFGGNDGNNLLVPIDSRYNDYVPGRGPLAIARGSLLPLNGTTGNNQYGIHPSMPNLAALYNQGHATFVANLGPLNAPLTASSLAQGAVRPTNLLDHTTQLAAWEACVTTTISSTGWAGRLADITGKSSSSPIPTVVSTAGWSLLGTGQSTQAVSVSTTPPPAASLAALQNLTPVLNKLEQGDPLNHLHDSISKLQTSLIAETGTVNAALQAGSTIKTQFPNTSVGQQLQLIAQMIKGNQMSGASKQVFFCQDGNLYDSHIAQNGYQATNLAGIDAAVAAFVAAMIEIGMFQNVCLFTMSEFGRSKQVNGGVGSDHGWGNHLFLVGGAVKGGQIYGTFPSLVMGGDDDFGKTGIWIPTTSSSQYAATLSRWLGVSSADISSIFPELANFQQSTLSFL